MLKAELFKCSHDINNMPKEYWKNGMVYEDECYDAERIASFDSIDEGLEELAKCECSATYLGGISKVTRATEYWLEINEYDDENGEFFQTLQCYAGKYPIVERRNALKKKMKAIIDSVSKLKCDAMYTQSLINVFKFDAEQDMASSTMDNISEASEDIKDAIESISRLLDHVYDIEDDL